MTIKTTSVLYRVISHRQTDAVKSLQKTKQSLKENLVDLKTSHTVCNVLAQHTGDTTKGLCYLTS